MTDSVVNPAAHLGNASQSMGQTDSTTYPATIQPRPFDRKLLELLVCPLTKQPLTYDSDRQELISPAARLAYPIRDGIPMMIVDEARTLDESMP